MMQSRMSAVVLTAMMAAGVTGLASATDIVVSAELVMLVDTSGSVDEMEYDLQRLGYAEAFENDALIRAITESPNRSIAVQYVEWSDATHQQVMIDWTLIDSTESSEAFAAQVRAIVRSNSGSTKIAPAIEFAAESLRSNDYRGAKSVIDISGDGVCQNWEYYTGGGTYDPDEGTDWDTVISAAMVDVDVINGICITTDEDVVNFYSDVLPQGDGSFALQVSSFFEFDRGILRKLLREIGIPVGSYD